MKTFVIGDVHGCFAQLQSLLKRIKPNLAHDRLVMLGDYIDRGPNSYLTVQKIIQLQKTFGSQHVVLLRGNHEQLAVDFYQSGSNDFFWNGGKDTKEDFRNSCDDLKNYVSFFQSLPTYFEDDYFIYVHGGIRCGIELNKQKQNNLLWLREDFYLNPKVEPKTIIFGHTPTWNINGNWHPFISNGRIGIDTGCVYGGYLTAVEINNGMLEAIYQVGRNASKAS